ncbi:benzyl alcohol O-benzoyltransferase-like [Silene latifolia]|uniref:benzyl alcohol O-benzoyltransferase-like n=1 Tax=Silene latifolia TaxID=37657 RepID=UPI003D788303
MSEIVSSQKPLVFKVTKQKPELIAPAKPTPNEFKELSEIDNQQRLRFFITLIQFYRSGPVDGPDPAKVIKEALGKALVAYYPLAGRLRQKEQGRLVIECNGEGIMFVEAHADVSLAQFGELLIPPFPCMEELHCDTSNSDAFLDYPFLLVQLRVLYNANKHVQVTRLKCGGFILTTKQNHAVLDAPGITQFMHAVAELVRGAEFPSVHPVWDRHLLCARNPPRVTCMHPEYDDEIDGPPASILPFTDVVHKIFFFGPTEIGNIRRLLPVGHSKKSTRFEILTACIWRSRTIAMQFNPKVEVRLRFLINFRHHKRNPPIPKGYYGNLMATPVAISTAQDLISNPLEYTLELIKNVKRSITEEYIMSMVDFLGTKGRPRFHRGACTYYLVDVSRVGLDQWDFGWGKPVYGGPSEVWFGRPTTGFGNYYLGGKNGKGETGILVPMCLPRWAMGRFVEELKSVSISGSSRM